MVHGSEIIGQKFNSDHLHNFEGVLLVYPVSWAVSVVLMTLSYINLRKKVLRTA